MTSLVRDFVDRVFDGAASPLLAHLVRDTRLSKTERAELRRLIDGVRNRDAGPARASSSTARRCCSSSPPRRPRRGSPASGRQGSGCGSGAPGRSPCVSCCRCLRPPRLLPTCRSRSARSRPRRHRSGRSCSPMDGAWAILAVVVAGVSRACCGSRWDSARGSGTSVGRARRPPGSGGRGAAPGAGPTRARALDRAARATGHVRPREAGRAPPSGVGSLEPDARRAVLCHELVHVARRDWPWIVAENVVRAALWFHPAVWWLIDELHVSREQVVDRDVVRRTGARKAYMEALLWFTDTPATSLPATAFLHRRHLRARLRQLSEESPMRRIRLVVSPRPAMVLVTGFGSRGSSARCRWTARLSAWHRGPRHAWRFGWSWTMFSRAPCWERPPRS